jgi:membrane-associated phospholipid phosphatase
MGYMPFTWGRFFRQALGLAVLMMSSLGGYLVVLKWRGGDARLCTHTAWDDWFPFEPSWVWVYLLPYLVGPAAIGFVSPATFRWYVKRGLVVVGLSLLIFILVPTQIAERQSLEVLDSGITSLLYNQMVAIDEPPANAAPSLHVSLTFLLALALGKDFPKWRPVTALAVALVWLATLFTRQHHLIDVASGILLAAGVVWLWPARSPDPERKLA